MKMLSQLAAVALLVFMPIATATAQTKPAAPTGASMRGDAAIELKQDMRKLWTDHVVWTRYYIIAAVSDQPDAKAASDRLLRNQDDIGTAMAKYYGAPAGQQLATLLKEHITIAVELIKAAKTGEKDHQKMADAKWLQNATQIADFLAKANPNWPRETLLDLMKTHLSTTTDEVVARINKRWAEDVKAFDMVYDHILKMSDALTDGIVKQFPDKFAPRPTN